MKWSFEMSYEAIIKRSESENGIIERLELKNFMCHRFLELELNPQVNFIIGKNGSK